MLSNNKIWRSLLFVPANSWKMLNKSLSQMQDGVIIDLEDACPILEKDAGRKFARDIMPMLKAKGIDVIVRVNSLSTGMTIDDLKIVITEDIDGIMLPNSETKDDIIQLAGLIDEIENAREIKKRTDILPLIESPQGVINAYDIGIASDRITALAFGAGDFMRELGEGFTIAKMTPDEYFPVLHYPRSLIATTACAIGIPAIDTPYFGSLNDVDGLERESSKVKPLGFKGKMITHPRHIEPVNRIFSPSAEDIKFSQRMVDAYKEAEAKGKGSSVLDGKMIDFAMYKMGMAMIEKANKIAEKELKRVVD